MTPINPGTLTSKSRPIPSATQFESYGGSVIGGPSLGIISTFEDDDRRPSTPRNSSPSLVLQSEFVDNSCLFIEGNHEEIIGFGYSCKIFRDDEKAKAFDENTHLIKWMGDEETLIDRYDCRGFLTDLSKYEAGAFLSDEENEEEVGVEAEPVTEEELDRERYMDLDEEKEYEDTDYNEELNYKRFQDAIGGVFAAESKKYANFQYNYDQQTHEVEMGPEPKRLHDDDSPYVKPVGLYVPEELKLPATMKVHAIIEKTAKFIAEHGSQMEIILKTKQAANPLFKFLNHDGVLNPYYKFITHAIRGGMYRPVEQDPCSEVSSSDDIGGGVREALRQAQSINLNEDDSSHTYLHPSLRGASGGVSSVSSTLSTLDSTVTYAAGASSSNKHNAYSMLVSKIKGTDSPDPTIQHVQSALKTPDYRQRGGCTSTNYGYKSSASEAEKSVGVGMRPKNQLPSMQDQAIIEKMARYVIKNGANFEMEVKGKGDPRFSFLDPSHEYHWYYLNCRERFKATCDAVVAKSEFVNYSGSSTNSGSSSSGTAAKSALPPLHVKKSAVAAELAEMKKKMIGNLAKIAVTKEKVAASSTSVTPVDDVFSRGKRKLVSAKDRDKPVIRFATSLSLTGTQISVKTTVTPIPILKLEPVEVDTAATKENEPVKVVTPPPPEVSVDKSKAPDKVEEKEEGEIESDTTEPDPEDSDPVQSTQDLDPIEDSDPFEDPPGNLSPVSEDDDEKVRRRMERKRKAALFLQKLKMSKSSGNNSDGSPAKLESQSSSCRKVPSPLALVTKGTSLGDLLSQRVQSTECSGDPYPSSLRNYPESAQQAIPNGRDLSSSPSSRCSRSYERSPSRHKTKKRRRNSTRSNSSSISILSTNSFESDNRSSTSKKKMKKKHKKKKKKHEKSRSSHKSKRR